MGFFVEVYEDLFQDAPNFRNFLKVCLTASKQDVILRVVLMYELICARSFVHTKGRTFFFYFQNEIFTNQEEKGNDWYCEMVQC